MTLQAVFFDFGGVISRTEFQAPRQHLAERLKLDYEDLVKIVFESESSRQASLGAIKEDEHWAAVMRRLKLPVSESQAFIDEFFGGDVLDRDLLVAIRALRPNCRTGLISNAWSGLRGYIAAQDFADAFDEMVISAEIGQMKPAAGIYLLALEKLGVAPAESVFLDDFIENVEGARAVGMQAIHFRQPEQALEELRRMLDHR